MADFKLPPLSSRGRAPETHDQFLESLTGRDIEKFPYYHGHQTTILNAVRELDENQRDVAICLPTGTGKTAIALSIGGLAQRENRAVVLYLTPTKQLVDQVLAEAKALTIPAVSLKGKWDSVDADSKEAYRSGRAIGVASYHTLFNSRPRVDPPSIILFDDVHAAADAAINPWALRITSERDPKLFNAVKAILGRYLSGPELAVLGERPPPERPADLVKMRPWLLAEGAIHDAISQYLRSVEPESRLRHPWRKAQHHLRTSFCFLEPGAISIRPLVPPSFSLEPFIQAKRRFYLTATLDSFGHLERVMGLDSVERIGSVDIAVPGFRMILNGNRLAPGFKEDADRVAHLAMKEERALILVPSKRDQYDVVAALQRAKYPGVIYGVNDDGEAESESLEHEISAFRATPNGKHAALVLANRYDGIDLGRGDCRLLILWKLPDALGPLEGFTTTMWRQREAADARARQRLQQGMGRCTRHIKDNVVVMLVGDDLLRFVMRAEIQDQFPPRQRAELQYGLENLRNPDDLDTYLRIVMRDEEPWRILRQEIAAIPPPEKPKGESTSDKIKKVHRWEAGFNHLLWGSSYEKAALKARSAAQQLVSLGDEGGAAIWFYFESVAWDLDSYDKSGSPYSPSGTVALKEALDRHSKRVWFMELARHEKPPSVEAATGIQVAAIEAYLAMFPPQSGRLSSELDAALANLGETSADPYHQGLKTLGESLGFKASVPKRDAGADCLWAQDNMLILCFQAKTAKENNVISVEESRQVVTTLAGVEAVDRLQVRAGSKPVLVTEVKQIAYEAAHEREQFFVARTPRVAVFATRWFNALQRVAASTKPGSEERRIRVAAALQEVGGTPESLPMALGLIDGRKALEPAPQRK